MQTAIQDLLDLLKIPGLSTEEAEVSAFIERFLHSQGVPANAIRRDRAFEQSEYGGQTGNLIVHLPRRGDHAGPSRLFMAHIDTVPLCRGAKPRYVAAADGQPAKIVNDNPASALGADNRGAVAILFHLVRTLAADRAPHPPIWLVFTVQEELGLIGARGLDVKSLAPDAPTMAFNYDGSRPNRVITAVTGTSRIFIELYGKAAHTGINPQDGVSTAVAAAKAIADLAAAGLHGPIKTPDGAGSGNIGILHGGEMTNTVMDRLSIRGEVRSHNTAFRNKLVDLYVAAFQRHAAGTQNAAGQSARMDWKLGPCYDSFAIPDSAPVVQTAMAAMNKAGVTPETEVNDGGMDANWINAKGLPMVTMGTGQHGAHNVSEYMNVDEFLTACRIIEALAVE
ncbi:MAG: M20/M25/M40 family metallo-hydrolase [Phycisphaerae bacterium]|nr:M20/M25/M40 family metallo-hydrolase [Phycisphaerae bacterium]